MLTDIRRHYRFTNDQAVVVDILSDGRVTCRLACLEPRQLLSADSLPVGPMLCYVLEGTAAFGYMQREEYVSAGGLLAVESGAVTICNGGAVRLAVMIVVSA